MSNQQLAQQFYETFTKAHAVSALHKDLAALIQQCTLSPSSDSLARIHAAISELRRHLVSAGSEGYLPSYDQSRTEQQLRSLEQSAERLRTTTVPKSKFAFRRAAPPAPSGPPPSGSTRRTSGQPAMSTSSAPSSQATTMSDTSASSASASRPATDLTLRGQTHSYLDLSWTPSAGRSELSVAIADLDHCVVNLLPSTSSSRRAPTQFSAVHILNVTNSLVLLPPLSGSIMVHDARRSTIVAGCHQLRIHTSSKVDVYLSISSNPIIEHSSQIRFTSYPEVLDNTRDGGGSANFSVQDFSHVRDTASPNWSVLADSDRIAEDTWPEILAASRDAAAGNSWTDKLERTLPNP
ncbi:TBCC-domain-containing protein [Punctularia strigosozonata HHB-11173 SS5]|uniref:TBCC-domain-containing protein n=1 Tax=Punctularia strigosozonata (strain HHB-11173) TaxID=741275 RepID=UPI0004417BFA|nr:TBCC-domain-containing protein [Punctularia strigosozonata HHB-11173 SS5]EIN14501.1 TBCC-domain-containing protein [Punctularia strigosozonata HHB-11173 SS5]